MSKRDPVAMARLFLPRVRWCRVRADPETARASRSTLQPVERERVSRYVTVYQGMSGYRKDEGRTRA